MTRHLATVQKISKIEAHDNADTLEIASVLGWKCIVKKGEFKEGQFCVYLEADSFLPIKPEFEFLRNSCYKKFQDGREGFRLKTIRLRGKVSQGLVLPIEILGSSTTAQYDILLTGNSFIGIEEGKDVSELLEVVLYEPPIPKELHGIAKGAFPSFLAKTDETRVQVLQSVLTRHKGTKCYVTEKIDGTSVTYYLKDGVFGVCGRNIEFALESTCIYVRMAQELKIEEKLRSLGYNVAIQGELFGAGVQGNPLSYPKTHVLFFNLFDIDSFRYCDFEEFVAVMKRLGLEAVPILHLNFILDDDIDGLVEESIGASWLNRAKPREGIVIRPLIEKMDMELAKGFGSGRVSFKAVNPEYLLKYGG